MAKVTVNLPDETLNALKELAKSRGLTYTEALRQAIESEKFLQKEVSKGSKLLLEDPDSNTTRQLVFR